MPDDPRHTPQDPIDAQDARQEWEAPNLVELGSFDELTQFMPQTTGNDTEGFSQA